MSSSLPQVFMLHLVRSVYSVLIDPPHNPRDIVLRTQHSLSKAVVFKRANRYGQATHGRPIVCKDPNCPIYLRLLPEICPEQTVDANHS